MNLARWNNGCLGRCLYILGSFQARAGKDYTWTLQAPSYCRSHLHDCRRCLLQVARSIQNAQHLITRLRRLFAAYGHPEHVVTDNGTQFTSAEFKNFMHQNGILHSTSAPGHPASNGLAERYVQTFKSGIKKLSQTTLDIEDKISVFLMQYCCTPNCTTGQSPADLVLNRHMQTRLDLMHPDTAVTVRKKQYAEVLS